MNNAISLLIGLITGIILIGLIEEGQELLPYPPLIAAMLGKGFVLVGYHIAFYQLVVLGNAVLWGLNLGPGFLAVVETLWKDEPKVARSPGAELGMVEVPLLPVAPSPADGGGLHQLTEVYSQYEEGAIDAEEYKRVRKQLVHEWHLSRQKMG